MFDKKVIFILLVSMLLASLVALLTDNEMDDEKSKALFIHKTHTTKNFDLIVAGDSRVYRGVSAKLIGKELNMTAMNLGYSSGGYGKDLYDLIDKQIDSSAPRKIIILGITPFSLTERAVENGHIKGMLDLKKETVLEYEYLFPLKNFFAPTTPAKIRKDIIEKGLNKYRQEIHIDEGWIASWYDIPNPFLALKDYKKTFSETSISQEVINRLYEKIKEWKNKGITVYGFLVPTSVNMVELEKNIGKFNPESFVKGFMEAGGQWITIENRYSSYDGSHLDKESAIRLSKELSYKIKNSITITTINPDLRINDIYGSEPCFKMIHIKNPKNLDTLSFDKKSKSLLYSIKSDSLIKNKIKNIDIRLSLLYSEPETNSLFGSLLNEKRVEINCDYSTIPNKWCRLFLNFEVPDSLQPEDTFSIYIDNPLNKPIQTDSLIIYFHNNIPKL